MLTLAGLAPALCSTILRLSLQLLLWRSLGWLLWSRSRPTSQLNRLQGPWSLRSSRHMVDYRQLRSEPVLAAANLQDTLSNIPPTRIADIDEPADADDTEWWTATAPTVVTDVRVGFETPPANSLVGMQQIRVLVRATNLPARNVKIELWENGVKLT